jgi:hypothetical protein
MFLVISGGITGQLKNLSGKVFKDGSKVHYTGYEYMSPLANECQLTRCASTNTLSIVALLQQTMDTTNGKLETSFGRAGLRLGTGVTTSSLARLGFARDFARHCESRVGCA